MNIGSYLPSPLVCPSYLHNLSDLTLILQPLQLHMGCANQLITSEEGSGEPRISRVSDQEEQGRRQH